MSKSTPWRVRGWPKRQRDWPGLKVRTNKPMRNAYAELPAGHRMTIDHVTHGNALHLKGEPCKCCGVAIRISRVAWFDLELIQPCDDYVSDPSGDADCGRCGEARELHETRED